MTHDPLCPYRPESLGMGGTAGAVLNYQPEVPCQCDLIRTVRDDDRGTMLDTAHDPALHDEDCYLVELPDFAIPQCTCRLRPLITALVLGPKVTTAQ